MRLVTWVLAGWFLVVPIIAQAQERLRIEIPATVLAQDVAQQQPARQGMSKKRGAAYGALIGFVPGFVYAASKHHEPGTRPRWVSGLWLGSNTAALG